MNDGNKVTVWLLLGAVKALLLSASNNQKLFRELLILAEHRAMKTGNRKLYFIHPMADDEVLSCLTENAYTAEGYCEVLIVREGKSVISLLPDRITGCSRSKAKHFVETSRIGEEVTHVGESGVAA